MSFKFVQKEDDMVYKPEVKTTSFYQICKFPISGNTHSVRKVVVNEMGQLIQNKEKQYKASKLKKFIDRTNTTKYKIYATHLMSLVKLPNASDILTTQSPLLNNDDAQGGYASWN